MIHRDLDDVETLEVSEGEEERTREGTERDKAKNKAKERGELGSPLRPIHLSGATEETRQGHNQRE